VRAGEAVGPARTERRRQDDLLLHGDGAGARRSGHDRDRRLRRHLDADVPPRAAGHRLPAAGSLDLSRPDGRKQHPRRPRSRPRRAASARARRLDELLEEFHIAHLRKAPSIALSGGERRRLEIARALASRPNFMLLDEPFAGVDPIAVSDIQQLVRHLTARGIGVLITDHNVRETLGLIERAYIIHAGRGADARPALDIVDNPDVRRLYLGEAFTL
jgi:ABC-type sugar transport system ATPase subunit